METFKPNNLINKLNSLFQDDPYVIGEWALQFFDVEDDDDVVEHNFIFNNVWKEKRLDGTILYPEVIVGVVIYSLKLKQKSYPGDYIDEWYVSVMDENLPDNSIQEKILKYIIDIIEDSIDKLILK